MSAAGAQVAVVLPAFNEAATIAETVRAFRTALPEARIVVVDNASTDGTAAAAREALAQAGNGQLVTEPRPGKGNALRRAFMEVEADAFLMCDADLTYPAESARELLAPVLDGGADMVVGDRHSGGDYARENRRALHGFGNNLVRALVNRLFRSRLADIMSGYRALSRRFVKHYPILVEGFQVETDMTLHALDKRFRIVEVPVRYRDRQAGSQSKVNTLADGARILVTIFQILRHYRPLLFFGTLSVLAALAGLLAGIPVLDDWFTRQYIDHVPLAILAAALEVVAVVTFGIGLILDSIVHHQRLDYERALLKK